MARPLARALIVAALAVALTSAGATAASAERWWGGDRSQDVQQLSYSPEPPPCGTVEQSIVTQDATTDIVGLSVRHEKGAVELRAHFRDLTIWGDRRLSFDLETDRRAYEVSLTKRDRRGPVEASLWEAAPPPEALDECGSYGTVQFGVPCPELVMARSPAQDTVTVTMPRSCLRSPRWVRAGVRTQRTVSERFRFDVWGHRSISEPVAFSGPFGPRVRRD